MRALVLPLTFSFLLLPARSDASALRCGSDIVSEGASKADALLKCGEPLHKETRTEVIGEKAKVKGQEADVTTERVITRTIDEWTYNFGPHRLMQTAVFVNGKLVEVRSGNYGR